MNNNPIVRKIYISEEMDTKLRKTDMVKDVTVTELIRNIIDAYFKKELGGLGSGIVQEDVANINDKLQKILQVCEANYRISDYTANLMNLGIASSDGKVSKPNEQAKTIARKKANNDFSKLKTNDFVREDFLSMEVIEEAPAPAPIKSPTETPKETPKNETSSSPSNVEPTSYDRFSKFFSGK